MRQKDGRPTPVTLVKNLVLFFGVMVYLLWSLSHTLALFLCVGTLCATVTPLLVLHHKAKVEASLSRGEKRTHTKKTASS